MRRESDLLFIVDLVVGELRQPIYVALEHQSTRDALMPLRALVYMGEIWGRHVTEQIPRPRTLPFILPLVLVQSPARTTPKRLSQVLDVPDSIREILGLPVELELLVDDLSGSVLGDPVAPPAFRALVEITRFLLHAHKNPRALEDPRLPSLPPLFDLVLEHFGPDDVRALWRYIVDVFEVSSELRATLVRSVTATVKEVYMTIAEDLVARGRIEGRAAAKAEVLLDVLEHRALSIPSHVRERVLSTPDEPLLQQWLHRAFAASSLEEVFG